MLIYDPIYDEPLLRGEPPSSDHLPVPRGCPLNGCSTVQREKFLNLIMNKNNAVFRKHSAKRKNIIQKTRK